MENISRRLSSDDTATSMYLSFDADSTMSTACYKTMEAMSDISTISMIEGRDESVNMSQDKDMNSTLEAQGDSLKSPLKTVKKIETMATNNPLKALPKNILKDYIALSSTPSKEQLLKTVDVTRGSDATRCIDLGLAFLGVDDETPAYFPPPSKEQCEENKENALPESEEGSTLSVSSSAEITSSVIERKMLSSMSTLGSTTAEESIVEIKEMEKVEEYLVAKKAIETTPKAKENMIEEVMEVNDEVDFVNEFEISPKAKVDRLEVISEVLEKTDELTPTVKEIEVTKHSVASKSSGKPKIAILASRNTRRSVCEPNLQTNRPSRIVNIGQKRHSLLPTSTKSSTLMDAETEIPLLMSKMLKISNNNNTSSMEVEVAPKKGEPKNEQKKFMGTNEKRRSIMASMKTRSSLIPSATGDKRPFSFTQRMSVVVKTTLNSPARKIARKSTMSSQQRRSFLPSKTNTEQSSKISQDLLVTRKSMLPKTGIPMNNKTTIKTIMSVKESTSTTATQRKSTYPLTKVSESKIKPPSGLACNKPDATFTCNVCKEKFRIKSLLDAHKRSHEVDNATPAFIKKSIASATHSICSRGSLLGGNSNQCKYCDKKFALIKALHIHLLQNCSKIPPADKRKLQYTDLNHVEKAQLPKVFTYQHPYQCSNSSSTVTSTSATPRNVFKYNANSMTAPNSSLESLNENRDVQKTTTDMAPPLYGTVQKIKKNTAHAGVYRTPSKMVTCHLCKSTFKSILDYTNHSLTAHGSNKTHHNSDKGNEVPQVE